MSHSGAIEKYFKLNEVRQTNRRAATIAASEAPAAAAYERMRKIEPEARRNVRGAPVLGRALPSLGAKTLGALGFDRPQLKTDFSLNDLAQSRIFRA